MGLSENIVGIIVTGLTIIVVFLTLGWILSPTDFTITMKIESDNNSKEIIETAFEFQECNYEKGYCIQKMMWNGTEWININD